MLLLVSGALSMSRVGEYEDLTGERDLLGPTLRCGEIEVCRCPGLSVLS